jgi:hypothetical protein
MRMSPENQCPASAGHFIGSVQRYPAPRQSIEAAWAGPLLVDAFSLPNVFA